MRRAGPRSPGTMNAPPTRQICRMMFYSDSQPDGPPLPPNSQLHGVCIQSAMGPKGMFTDVIDSWSFNHDSAKASVFRFVGFHGQRFQSLASHSGPSHRNLCTYWRARRTILLNPTSFSSVRLGPRANHAKISRLKTIERIDWTFIAISP